MARRAVSRRQVQGRGCGEATDCQRAAGRICCLVWRGQLPLPAHANLLPLCPSPQTAPEQAIEAETAVLEAEEAAAPGSVGLLAEAEGILAQLAAFKLLLRDVSAGILTGIKLAL